MKPKIFAIISLLVIGTALVYFAWGKHDSAITQNAPGSTTKPVIFIEPSPIAVIPSPAPQPTVSPSIKPSVVNQAVYRGQIVCNSKIPPAPSQQGSAALESNWTNIVQGNNGKTKVDVCVSVNGGSPTLITSHTQKTGSASDNINWISLDSNYTFNLFDTHGSDLQVCSGTILSSCQINYTTPVMQSPGLSHRH